MVLLYLERDPLQLSISTHRNASDPPHLLFMDAVIKAPLSSAGWFLWVSGSVRIGSFSFSLYLLPRSCRGNEKWRPTGLWALQNSEALGFGARRFLRADNLA